MTAEYVAEAEDIESNATPLYFPSSREKCLSIASRGTHGQKNQAPDFSEARSVDDARGTSARAAIHSFHFLEGWLVTRDLGAVTSSPRPIRYRPPCCFRPDVCFGAHYGLNSDIALGPKSVESRCGAVALGRTYLLPPLSSGGASMVPPWLRFHIPLIEPVKERDLRTGIWVLRCLDKPSLF